MNGRTYIGLAGLAVLVATWAGPLPRMAAGSFSSQYAYARSGGRCCRATYCRRLCKANATAIAATRVSAGREHR